ncbi:hypothetical protein [Streptomyces cinerochromogenes]|uniref:hypothetical protein n=1 Tax=Streptomyces cinerochromogenes TaxID=66422 RepID=UPI00166FDB80|nr:hypothetical protein [Streptomyces cinerochromogenes]GGT02652.1 hypothetical protein GCM10010206_76580 [Streptomyces cinerochromogenes]
MSDTFAALPAHPAAPAVGPAAPCSCLHPAAADGAEPARPAGRFGPTHALILLLSVLVLGNGLFLAGAPLETIFTLLGGLGAIGAATLAAAGSGRRLLTVLAEAAVRGAGK